MRGPHAYDTEKAHFDIARLKKMGETFEVVIDPDAAILYKQGKLEDIREVLKSEHVYHDAKDGELASEALMVKVLGTSNELEAAAKILQEGDIQLTAEYREKLRAEKHKRILDIIHTNAIDPKSGLPHPMQRLENAFKEAKVHIDEQKKAEDQVQDILKKLMPVLPIKFAVKDIEVHLPSQYAAKCYGTMGQFGKIKKDSWLNDGSWMGVVEIPAGLQNDFYDALNKQTHGTVDTKVLETR
ncbi:MAG: ribosome assembly factor SBDS [Candidatus Woesearchaeota archaeon]